LPRFTAARRSPRVCFLALALAVGGFVMANPPYCRFFPPYHRLSRRLRNPLHAPQVGREGGCCRDPGRRARQDPAGSPD
jgi:hypothetical protein